MTVSKPSKFFKYCRINEHSIDSIKNSTLWFSTSEGLNDPFDMKFKFSESFMKTKVFEAVTDQFQKFSSIYEHEGKPLTYDIFIDSINEMLEDKIFMEYQMAKIRASYKFSICCFSTAPENNLMWSHYADSHKGICLIYDFKYEPIVLQSLWPVNYTSEYPVIDNFDDFVNVGIFRKSLDWNYENEWRATKIHSGTLAINSMCLRGIIFGSKCEQKTIADLFERCNLKMRTEIEYFVVSEDAADYKLFLSPLKFEGLNL